MLSKSQQTGYEKQNNNDYPRNWTRKCLFRKHFQQQQNKPTKHALTKKEWNDQM